ncbi:trypsin-like peptidase domain-containing protein [Actinoallomurus sp. CA-150999]|uniref:nSTAND1 domain-containing NTPase n=1 Tax=Actinoallomurus sp. CA-150999 TaxID=3239887 RepID=UPI003D903CF3
MPPGTALGAAIVRIHDEDGRPVGAGVLAGPDLVVTCAHVVAQALGAGAELPSARTVRVDFPLLAGAAPVDAEVVVWRPPLLDGSGDIAGLRLSAPPPPGVRMARLVLGRELWNHPFRAFGFPSRRDHGVWAAGVLRERTGAGWLQVEHATTTGFVIQPGFSGTPVWDDELQGVVGIVVAAEKRLALGTGYVIPSTALLESWPELKPYTLAPCPYRGLAAFREEDAPLFFGRDGALDLLAATVARCRVTTVLGPSGSGKSSLVAAGLLPRLRPEGTTVAWMRPMGGATPAAACAAAFLPLLEPDLTEAERLAEVPKLAAVLAGDGLVDVADRALARTGARRLVLVVDQMEELLAAEPAGAATLVSGLRALASSARLPRSRVRIVCALRSDFLDQALGRLGVAELLRDGLVTVPPMHAGDLRGVVEGPMPNISSVAYEAGLVDRILDDVGSEPGALPLLEFALTLLWETQSEGLLSHRAYDGLGGVTGALARYAERVWTEDVDPGAHEAARRLLVRLVRPGSDGRHTRQVVRRSELPAEQWEVAGQLAMTRLVVSGRTAEGEETAELTHEALITQWERLRGWITTDLDFLLWRQGLREAVGRWLRAGRDHGALLRSVQLEEARRWLAVRSGDLTDGEREFIRAGVDRHRRTRRLRRVAGASLSVLLAAALVLGLLFVLQRGDTAHQRTTADAEALATESRRLGWTHPTAAALLAVAAYRARPTARTYANLADRYLQTRDLDLVFEPDLADVGDSVVLSDDARHAVTLGTRGLDFWDLDVRPVRRHSLALGYQPLSAAWSLSGDRLATAGPQGQITLWDPVRSVRTGAFTVPLGPRSPRVVGLQFTGNGGLLIRLGGQQLDDRQVLVSPDALAHLPSPPALTEVDSAVMGVTARGALLRAPVAKAPDWQTGIRAGTSARLAFGPLRGDPAFTVRDASTGRDTARMPLTGDEQLVSRDGRVLVDMACRDGSRLDATVWDLTGESPARTIASTFDCQERHSAQLDSLGRYLVISTPTIGRVASGTGTNITVWDLTNGRIAAVHIVAAGGYLPVESAVVQDGSILAVAEIGGAVAVVRVRLGAMETLPERLTQGVAAPGGSYLATASAPLEGEQAVFLRLWSTDGRRLLAEHRLPSARSELPLPQAMLFTPDDRTLITAEDDRITVWNAPDLVPRRTMTIPGLVRPDDFPGLAADDHGNLIVARGGTLSRWNLNTGARSAPDLPLPPVQGRPQANARVAARPHTAQFAVSGGAGGGLDLRSGNDGQVERTLAPPAGLGTISALAFDHTGRYLIGATDTGQVAYWDLDSGAGTLTRLRTAGEKKIIDRYVADDTGSQIDVWDAVRQTRIRSIPAAVSVTALLPGLRGLLVGAELTESRFYAQGRFAALAVVPLEPEAMRDHLCRISAHPALTPDDRAALARGVDPPGKACP